MLALFGKLPARRDFIAREVPAAVLETMEPWLQHAMAQSRETLGSAWLDLYLAAPLWRFWWSSGLSGYGIAGAMMPSVDKMGRYFPLLAFAVTPRGSDFALPSLSDDAWYHGVETTLLSALTQDGALEPFLANLDTLAPTAPRAAVAARAMGGSLWWSLGSGDEPPRRAAWSELPPPTAFADMLRGLPAADVLAEASTDGTAS